MTYPRIAALQPSVSVTLAGLGRLDHLAVCTKWCVQQVPSFSGTNLPVLPDSWSASPEDLAQLRDAQVDLVIASVPYRQSSLTALLQSGLPVLALAPRSLAEIYADTRLLGALVDARKQAEKLIAEMQQALATTLAVATTATGPKPKVCCEEWNNAATGTQPGTLIHSQPWVNELVSAAAGDSIGQPGSHAQPAQIANADPDALILAWCGAGDRVPLARVAHMRHWTSLRAVQQRRMYCIPDEMLNTPAIPSLLEGLACVAHCVHPDLFKAPAGLRRIAGNEKE